MSIGTEDIKTAQANGIEIAYDTFGDASDPPVLLIMGLGTQMIAWHEDFCRQLTDKGLYVIRFDNRDIGLSTHLHDAPAPDLQAVVGGDTSSVTYTLSDMAADTAGLIDALGLESAHIVGASMGGMIAQVLCIEHPERVRSLVSIMSTTGDPSVGTPSQEAVAVLLAPPAADRESHIERSVQGWRVIGSPGFEVDEEEIRDRAARSFDRAFDPPGIARQFGAILAYGDRTAKLRELEGIPTLVMHGREDVLVNVSGGEATHAAIAGSELIVIDGMSHDLPRGAWPQIIDPIAAHVKKAEG